MVVSLALMAVPLVADAAATLLVPVVPSMLSLALTTTTSATLDPTSLAVARRVHPAHRRRPSLATSGVLAMAQPAQAVSEHQALPFIP